MYHVIHEASIPEQLFRRIVRLVARSFKVYFLARSLLDYFALLDICTGWCLLVCIFEDILNRPVLSLFNRKLLLGFLAYFDDSFDYVLYVSRISYSV